MAIEKQSVNKTQNKAVFDLFKPEAFQTKASL